MRYLMAVCLLAGCYKPSTDSCYYACATQGTPCPSGLTCVAGMCAAPGDDCSAAGDGGADAGIADAAPVLCGDGIPTIGEVCFGTPIMFVPQESPGFGHLADRDGDGDVDLIYVDKLGYQFHLNTGGVLSPGAISGPMLPEPPGAMLTANLNGTPGVELINTQPFEIQGHVAVGSAPHMSLFIRPYPQFPPAIAMAFGQVTTTPVGALVVSHGSNLGADNLVVYRFDTPSTLTQMGSYPVSGARRIALGRLDADLFDDVVVATDSGVVVFLGSSLNLGSPSQVGPNVRVENVVTGDFNNDNQDDVVFTTVSATTGTGTINILPGRGTGAFNPVSTMQIPTLGAPLAVADVDRDGRADAIAFQGGPSAAVLIVRGKPDGTLDTPIKIMVPTSSATHLSARGDVNGDMVPDIVLTDTNGRRLLVIPSRP